MNNSSSKEQIINQAIKFHLEGNIPEAIKYYKYCITQGFNDPRIFCNYGAILQGLGKLQEAKLSYRKAIELKPDYAIAYSNLGNILRNLGKLQEAELSTRKAIELKPDYANAYSNLGNVLRDLGKLQEAELSTRKAIELDPNFINAHYNLGNILKDLGKLQKAEISYRKAIQLKPDFAEAHSNLGNILRDLGKLQKAEISYRKAIQLKPDFAEAHCNLAATLFDLGKLQEAELSIRKAIELNPDLAEAHCNLGNILSNLGKLQEAELSICKAIELNPNHTIAYYAISLFKVLNTINTWREQLFSKNLLHNKSKKDQVNIYFSRANILHRESNFKESSNYLQLANNLNQQLNPTKFEYLIKHSKELMMESNKENINENENTKFPHSIFIVGMPRSGSTLLESIISMNNNVDDLGEKNIFEESFLKWRNINHQSTLAELYLKKITTYSKELRTTTNKWLYNYKYSGIICTQIPNSKIIHCFRNPLDNILSIYRTKFAQGNEYSSSLIACAKVYLNQEEVMTKYKKKFRAKIYDLNYDLLVSNPNEEIKSLISWLGWKWDKQYLSPHKNPRSISTASNIQVRSPINSKSVGGWKNYKELLKPAMEIITQNNKYKDLKY